MVLNNHGTHDMMWCVMGGLKNLSEKISNYSLLENKSTQSASSLSSSSGHSSGNSTCTNSSLKSSSSNHLALTQPIVSIMPNTIKGLDFITTLTRWCNKHWFLKDNNNLSAKKLMVF